MIQTDDKECRGCRSNQNHRVIGVSFDRSLADAARRDQAQPRRQIAESGDDFGFGDPEIEEILAKIAGRATKRIVGSADIAAAAILFTAEGGDATLYVGMKIAVFLMREGCDVEVHWQLTEQDRSDLTEFWKQVGAAEKA